MTEQLSGMVQKLAYRVYLTEHFPGCIIRRLPGCRCVPHRESHSMGGFSLFTLGIQNKLGRQDRIIVFYMGGITKPMACYQDDPRLTPWSWNSVGGPPLFKYLNSMRERESESTN